MSDRIYIWSILCLSEETLLLGPPFLTFPLACYLWEFELNTLTIVHSSLNQSTFSDKNQGLIYNFGPLPLQITKKKKKKHNVLQIPSTSFHILKLLNNSLIIINVTSYISFIIHNQTISSIKILFLNTIKIIIIIVSIVWLY